MEQLPRILEVQVLWQACWCALVMLPHTSEWILKNSQELAHLSIKPWTLRNLREVLTCRSWTVGTICPSAAASFFVFEPQEPPWHQHRSHLALGPGASDRSEIDVFCYIHQDKMMIIWWAHFDNLIISHSFKDHHLIILIWMLIIVFCMLLFRLYRVIHVLPSKDLKSVFWTKSRSSRKWWTCITL